MINLTDLYFYKNGLTGEIPIQIGNLIKLKILRISHNNISGSIPKEIGNLVNLNYLLLEGGWLERLELMIKEKLITVLLFMTI